MLTVEDFEARYSSATAHRAFMFFDSAEDGLVKRGDVKLMLRRFYADRDSLSLEINSFKDLGACVRACVH